MMHIGLADLGFTDLGIDILIGNVEEIEITEEDARALENMLDDEIADYLLLNVILPEQKKSGSVSDQEHATATTETTSKETIISKPTAPFNSEKLSRAQVMMIASLVHSLDPKQNPSHLLQEVDAWRGMETMNKLCTDLVNVLSNATAEVKANDPEPVTQPTNKPLYNARTTERLVFHPVPGAARNTRAASLPKNTRVHAYQNTLGAITLFAWVDNAEGPADYSHQHALLSDFRMED